MSTWLTTIVINSARIKLRRRLSQVQLVLDEPCGEQNLSLADIVSDTRPDPEETHRKRQIAKKAGSCHFPGLLHLRRERGS
jgi:hypothetical protein